MKKILIALIAIAVNILPANAQCISWKWKDEYYPPNLEEIFAAAIEESEEIYIASLGTLPNALNSQIDKLHELYWSIQKIKQYYYDYPEWVEKIETKINQLLVEKYKLQYREGEAIASE